MRLRVGIVGLGSKWTSRHSPALRALADRFEVRAVCEEVSHKAEMVARQFNATPVDGFHCLTRREDIDAILILSDQWYGPLPILAACDAAKAVFCWSNWKLEPSQAAGLKQRVDDAGIAFMAGFPRRFAPATIRLKELIATHLGAPRLLYCHVRAREEASNPPDEAPLGTPLGHHGREMLEAVDWCRYVVGSEPTSVLGFSHQAASAEQYDYQMMSLDFSGRAPGEGPAAQISSGSYISPQWPEAVSFRPPAALQVCCERGIAFVDLPATVVWFDEAGRHLETLETDRPIAEQLLRQFHREVTSLVRKTASLEDAYRALTILETAEKSFQEGQRLPIRY